MSDAGVLGRDGLDRATVEKGLAGPFAEHESDHTALVHVLWSAQSAGALAAAVDADAVATWIMRSRWRWANMAARGRDWVAGSVPVQVLSWSTPRTVDRESLQRGVDGPYEVWESDATGLHWLLVDATRHGLLGVVPAGERVQVDVLVVRVMRSRWLQALRAQGAVSIEGMTADLPMGPLSRS